MPNIKIMRTHPTHKAAYHRSYIVPHYAQVYMQHVDNHGIMYLALLFFLKET